jgi:hypothetical protein
MFAIITTNCGITILLEIQTRKWGVTEDLLVSGFSIPVVVTKYFFVEHFMGLFRKIN